MKAASSALRMAADGRIATMLARRYRLLTLVCVSFFWVLLVCCGLQAEQVAKLPAAPSNYVSDFANVLSPQVTDQTNALCQQLQQQAKAQLFVVTIKTLEDEPMDQFANDLFKKWGIGDKATNRGILLLLVTEEHHGRIEVGLGLEGVVTDSMSGRIGRGIRPAIQANDFNTAVTNGSRELAGVIAADAKVTLDNTKALPPEPVEQQTPAARIIGWLVVLAIFLLISRVFGGRGGRGGGYYGGYWGGGGGGWGGGGGGWGGGGGGGFSGGGGGSSGGGGASF
jgi:uncharacterized protein